MNLKQMVVIAFTYMYRLVLKVQL